MAAPSGPDRVARAERPAPDLRADGAGLRTLRDFIRLALSAFSHAGLSFGHGHQDAYDEAVALVFWSCHLPAGTPDTMLDARLTPGEQKTVLALIRQRVETRQPLAYLTGEAWLHGLCFEADARALVPRSLIVEALLDEAPHWAGSGPAWPEQVLDLCTGGGSIAIHAAWRFPGAAIVAADIDVDALALCRANVARHHLLDRITVRQSDLFGQLDPEDRFDLILCNPPYVPNHSMARLPDEYRAEPALALAAGQDGMAVIGRLLADAHTRLTDEGVLILEIGHEIDAFTRTFERLPYATLPVAAGDQMVLLLTRQDLLAGLPS